MQSMTPLLFYLFSEGQAVQERGNSWGRLTTFLCGLKNACKMTPVKRQNNLPHGKVSFKNTQALCYFCFLSTLLQLERFSLVSLDLRSFLIEKDIFKKVFCPLWLSEVYPDVWIALAHNI